MQIPFSLPENEFITESPEELEADFKKFSSVK